jgi:hypothetical protein
MTEPENWNIWESGEVLNLEGHEIISNVQGKEGTINSGISVPPSAI